MTSFGLVWVLLCISTFFLPKKYLAGLLIFSCVFQTAGVLQFGGKSLSPLFVTECFCVLRLTPIIFQKKKIRINTILKYLGVFVLIAVITTIFLPLIFENKVRVYSTDMGIDTNYFMGGVPLRLSFSSVIQIVFLSLHYLVLLLLFTARGKLGDKIFYTKSFIFSIVFVVFIGLWEFVSKFYNLIYFPKSFFITDIRSLDQQTALGGLMRLNATFLEPSFAGAFLAASFWAVYVSKFRFSKLLSVFILIALVFNLSGTGIVSFIFGAVIYILTNNMKKIFWIIPVVIVGYLGLVYSGYFDIIMLLITSKGDSHSGGVRLGAVLFSWELFVNTYMLGVGLGNHRGASFILNILTTTGLIGAILFGLFYLRLMKYLYKKNNDKASSLFIFYFALVLMFAQIIAIPDLSFSPFWMWIFYMFLTIQLTSKEEVSVLG
ncbi:hypothetical protein [Lutibacter sp. B1]|uniref:hypothetical protein n=1 Tax=Lutibacter sp. B1 TaxID=2725996 RepID=UPI0014571931|nr:hypothetical protein [Lutibacter sp. B1]NLP58826.1 hypothetical protein [Lutibacter sp. B1]